VLTCVSAGRARANAAESDAVRGGPRWPSAARRSTRRLVDSSPRLVTAIRVTICRVHKTTVYLPDDLKRRLMKTAQRRGEPEAALIRAAIERLLADESPPRPTLPLFRSGDPTLAERVDEALAGFGE